MNTLPSDPGPLLLETARPEELPVVMGILDECAAWLHGRGIAQWALPQSPHEWERMGVQIVLGHVSLARIEADRSLVGTLRIEWEDAPLWPDDPFGGGYVHALAICNRVRGHQIRVSLLQWAQGQIAERGRKYIRLDCWDENTQLRRYYETLGFRRCGDFVDGKWTGVLYEKEASPRVETRGSEYPAVQGKDKKSKCSRTSFVLRPLDAGNSVVSGFNPWQASSMPTADNNQTTLRLLPKVHALLETEAARALLAALPRPVVLDEVRAEVDALRQKVLTGEAAPPFDEASIFAAVRRRLAANDLRRLQRVVNATGIVIHTNMGRAPMAEAAVEAVANVARNYSNLELDLATGKRGGRVGQIEELLRRITGAEAVLVVNNNAAAVLLALCTVAQGGEVVISRGELVEIGGGFRVPDVITQSGARLVEVGTTNKTRIGDYAQAVTPQSKVLLKVHASNYKIIGFTQQATLPELVTLGQEHGLLVMNDLGSGALIDVTRFGLPYEPTVSETIGAGVDIAMVSGDKLLGGPQCGILLGKTALIARMAANPLFRALRADKLTLAALEATLRLYEDEERLTETVPVLHMLSRSKEELTRRARRLRNALAKIPDLETRLTDGFGYTGGGALPTVPLPTKWVQVRAEAMNVGALAAALRRYDPPVVGMLADGWLALDVRTVRDDEMQEIVQAVRDVAGNGPKHAAVERGV